MRCIFTEQKNYFILWYIYDKLYVIYCKCWRNWKMVFCHMAFIGYVVELSQNKIILWSYFKKISDFLSDRCFLCRPYYTKRVLSLYSNKHTSKNDANLKEIQKILFFHKCNIVFFFTWFCTILYFYWTFKVIIEVYFLKYILHHKSYYYSTYFSEVQYNKQRVITMEVCYFTININYNTLNEYKLVLRTHR